MPPIQRAPVVNRLLEALPSSDRRRMLAGCETVELAFADVLCAPGERLSHVYFPTRSFISLIMPIDEAASLEVGLVGNEGMFGIPLALGVDVSPVRAVVQGGGPALRMDAARFCRELATQPGAATRDRPLCLRAHEPARADGGLHALPRGRGAACPLAADDPGSRAHGHLPYHAGIHGLHAGRAPGRRHQGGERAAKAQSDSLHAAATSRCSTGVDSRPLPADAIRRIGQSRRCDPDPFQLEAKHSQRARQSVPRVVSTGVEDRRNVAGLGAGHRLSNHAHGCSRAVARCTRPGGIHPNGPGEVRSGDGVGSSHCCAPRDHEPEVRSAGIQTHADRD